MKPLVSVIVPCRNEARFVGRCLDSILSNDYPADRLEVIVADGLSEDGTREVIAGFCERDARVRMLDNPDRITPVALNRALEAARGEVIVRMDAHAEMTPNYISGCVEWLEASGADNVGGTRIERAQDRGLFTGPIVAALTHPFGVGNARYRFPAAAPRWVDTVFGGCWRREVFDRIGKFNERLPRTQDLEFNRRLRKAGGKVLLVPGVETRYYTRSRLSVFSGHNWTNGAWSVLPLAYSAVMPVGFRHLVPMGFVGALAVLAALSCFSEEWRWTAAAALGGYLTASLLASAQIAVRRRSLRYLALMPVAFASLHFSYGAGSWWGAMQLAVMKINRK